MKTNLNYIGIDVSKDTLDICILSKEASCFVINNTPKAIKSFLRLTYKMGRAIMSVQKILGGILGN